MVEEYVMQACKLVQRPSPARAADSSTRKGQRPEPKQGSQARPCASAELRRGWVTAERGECNPVEYTKIFEGIVYVGL